MSTYNSANNKIISVNPVRMTPAVHGKIAMEVSKLLHVLLLLVAKALREGVILPAMVRTPGRRCRYIADTVV